LEVRRLLVVGAGLGRVAIDHVQQVGAKGFTLSASAKGGAGHLRRRDNLSLAEGRCHLVGRVHVAGGGVLCNEGRAVRGSAHSIEGQVLWADVHSLLCLEIRAVLGLMHVFSLRRKEHWRVEGLVNELAGILLALLEAFLSFRKLLGIKDLLCFHQLCEFGLADHHEV